MVALPFCHAELWTPKPKSLQYPKQINGLGDHIRARRLDLKLLQKQVADQIGVHEQTITGWERNATSRRFTTCRPSSDFLATQAAEKLTNS